MLRITKSIHGVKVAPMAPSISHLCFADDLLLFCHANDTEINFLKGLLDQFQSVSGQFINYNKSGCSFPKSLGSNRQHELGC